MSKPDSEKTAAELIEELERLHVAGDEVRAKVKETIEQLRIITGKLNGTPDCPPIQHQNP